MAFHRDLVSDLFGTPGYSVLLLINSLQLFYNRSRRHPLSHEDHIMLSSYGTKKFGTWKSDSHSVLFGLIIISQLKLSNIVLTFSLLIPRDPIILTMN